MDFQKIMVYLLRYGYIYVNRSWLTDVDPIWDHDKITRNTV